MDAKLRLAFKKLFEKKISKEKYLDKQTEAAQKALEKVRKMKEARMFNISLYKYKGDIKGIKVVPKNPKTPNVTKDSEIIEEEPVKKEEVPAKEQAPVKEEPIKEEPPKEVPAKEESIQEEEEDIPSEDKPELPLHDLPEDFMKFLMEEMKKAEIAGKNVDIVENEEMDEPKPKKRGRKANTSIPQRRKNKVIEESLQQTAAIPQRVPKPVKPAPPRRGRVPDQKYVYTESKLNKPDDGSSLLPPGTPQPRIKRDYKNNKNDRLKAIQTITYLNK